MMVKMKRHQSVINSDSKMLIFTLFCVDISDNIIVLYETHSVMSHFTFTCIPFMHSRHYNGRRRFMCFTVNTSVQKSVIPPCLYSRRLTCLPPNMWTVCSALNVFEPTSVFHSFVNNNQRSRRGFVLTALIINSWLLKPRQQSSPYQP